MNRISNARSKFPSAAFLVAASLIVAPVVPLAIARPAQAQTNSSQWAAENFVRSDVQRGMGILNNRNLSDADRRAQLRDYLTSLVDIRHIAIFTLGPMRQYARPAQIDEFVNAFRDYAIAAYESKLTNYSGQYLRFTGSIQTAPDNYIVRTVLVEPNGSSSRGDDPIEVDFRVANDNDRYAVTDLGIAGIWLALEQRDQLTAYLEDHSGNFDALIVHVKVLTERLHRDSPPAQVSTVSQAH
jgi:phospholipid transport system substrate-binding protein